MFASYRANLGDLINPGSRLPEPEINETFRKYRSHIRENLRDRCGEPNYARFPANELLKNVQEHILGHRRQIAADDVLLLVHPFYLPLTHARILNADTRKDADRYLSDVFSALECGMPRGRFGRLVFETAHHYTTVTSHLLESGAIDDVIITEYDNGTPLTTKELQSLSDKTLYVGGGYNYKCLARGLRSLRAYAQSGGVWVVRDLVIDSPQDRTDSLEPGRDIAEAPSGRIISLKEFFDRMAKPDPRSARTDPKVVAGHHPIALC